MYYTPTQISYEHYHFLVMSAPDQKSMKLFIKDLKKNNVQLLVKSCEKVGYTTEQLAAEGIEVQELVFKDGSIPDQDVIDKWLRLVDNFFDSKVPQPGSITANAKAAAEPAILESKRGGVGGPDQKLGAAAATHSDVKGSKHHSNRSRSAAASQISKQPEKRIAVHCVAGLGRAPFLVALAIVYKGCKPQNAIKLIRNNRKGALNPVQANYILEMKPGKSYSGNTKGCSCNIF